MINPEFAYIIAFTACPTCRAGAGYQCRNERGYPQVEIHEARIEVWNRHEF